MKITYATVLALMAALLLSANSWGQAPLSWTRMNTDPKSLGEVLDSVLFDDGQGEKLYVAGEFRELGGSEATNLARFDGVAWEGIAAPVQGAIMTLAVFDEGSGPNLFLGGEFLGRGVLSGSDFIARFDGTSFSSVGGGANGEVRSLEVWDDGTGPALYVGGRFFTVGGLPSPMIAKWDGSQWSSLNGGAAFPGSYYFGVYALTTFTVGASQVLVAAGAFNGVGTPAVAVNNLAAWDGSNWSSLGMPANLVMQEIHTAAGFDSGSGPELYVGGSSAVGSAQALSDRILRYDGTLWSQLGTGIGPDGPNGPSGPLAVARGQASVQELRVFDDGGGIALHVGGLIGVAGGAMVNNWARWDGQAWTSPPARVDTSRRRSGFIRSLLPLLPALGGGVLVGGKFDSTGNGSRNSLARWTPSGMTDLGTASGALSYLGDDMAYLDRIHSYSDANGDGLLVTGRFNEIGGVPSGGIARWDGSSFQDVAGSALEFNEIAVINNGGTDQVLALGFDGVLARVGSNWVAQGPYGVAGSMWTSETRVTYADHGAGPILYAAGQLANSSFAYDPQGVYQLTGTTWNPLPPVPVIPQLAGTAGPQVFSPNGLIAWDDGQGECLYAYGLVSSTPVPSAILYGVVFQWNGQGWRLLPPMRLSNPPGFGFVPENAAVYESQNDAALYFTTSVAGGITRWTGSRWEPVGPTIPATSVLQMTMHDAGNGPELFVRGASLAGSALWAISGTSWRTVIETPHYYLAGMTSFDDGGGADLYTTARILARPNGRHTDIIRSLSAMGSRVGSSVGIPEPVLGVSVGGGAVSSPRSIEIPLGQSFSLDIAQPLTTAAPAGFALALFAGPPPPSTFAAPGFGDLCIPLPPSLGSLWFASAATGVPALVTGTTAPWTLPVPGGIPFATIVTLQGAIADDSAAIGFSLTNALSLRFR